VDTRDTPEQAELRRSARQLVGDLGPATVADLDDATRRKRLAAAAREAGWLDLRDGGGRDTPLASGVEPAIIADALGAAVADVAFAGPVLGADIARRAGVAAGAVVAFSPALVDAAIVTGGVTATATYAVDSDGADDDVGAYVLVPERAGYQLAHVRPIDPPRANRGSDLTRAVRVIPAGATLHAIDQSRLLTDNDLAQWAALGLALTSADLVGVMRGVLDVTVAYAADRRQYGVPVGSFQSVQHLLAEARCLMEGSLSVAMHASWAVDNLAPEDARAAGRVAKTYCVRAARTVCETAIQVHGGIGNTWECLTHVYLRRALLSSQWFGDDGVHLEALGRDRLGVGNGLP
jgi:hypothetical protein